MQMELFQDCFGPPQEHPPIWGNLSREVQQSVVRILARVIEKMVRLEHEGTTTDE